jgi:hypothetical protein
MDGKYRMLCDIPALEVPLRSCAKLFWLSVGCEHPTIIICIRPLRRIASSLECHVCLSHFTYRRHWCPNWRFVNRNDTPEITDTLLSNGWCAFFRRFGRDFRHTARPFWDVVPSKQSLDHTDSGLKRNFSCEKWGQFGKFSASGPLLRSTEYSTPNLRASSHDNISQFESPSDLTLT